MKKSLRNLYQKATNKIVPGVKLRIANSYLDKHGLYGGYFTKGNKRIILLNDKRADILTFWTWLHELGHALDPDLSARSKAQKEDFADEIKRRLNRELLHAQTVPDKIKHLMDEWNV